jgi:dTDP-4-dehydrorhamnose reductase
LVGENTAGAFGIINRVYLNDEYDFDYTSNKMGYIDKKGIYHISGPETMSVFEIVERVAKYYGLETHLIERTDSSTLSQPAKRPPRTGFNLSKAKQELDYNPKTLEETLALLV